MTTRQYISDFKSSTKRLPSQIELSKALKITPQVALKALIQYTKEEEHPVKSQTHSGGKWLRLSPLIVSAGLGVFLNGSYYNSSFLSAGYGAFFSLWLSVSLMLMEAILWLYKPGWIGNGVKIILLFFSVSMTLGAQFFSTSELQSSTAEQVMIATGSDEQIAYLRSQISKEDQRIDSIFEARAKDLVYTRTDDALYDAQKRKSNYEAELSSLLTDRTEDVRQINSPKTLYSWISDDMPKILTSGMTENLIRLLYQLISSILLALMAPISLSMIRRVYDTVD